MDFEVVRTFQKDVFYNSSIPKSLDRNHFNYIDLNFANLEDGAATFTYITADFIKKSFKILNREVKQIIVCGGGRKNKFLMGLLGRK
ncbi:MAG: anhydro-N-acetylmuramic acid kinase [Candidatus Midichloria sp.]|nr:anhydro-N-acetylmuramic acid kinase [Candidatus Midichloria sp.]